MFFINNIYLEKKFSQMEKLGDTGLYNISFKDFEENYLVKIIENKSKINWEELDFNNYYDWLLNISFIIETENKYYICYNLEDYFPLFDFILINNFTKDENLIIFYQILDTIKDLYSNMIEFSFNHKLIFINKNFNIKFLINNYFKNSAFENFLNSNYDEKYIINRIPLKYKFDTIQLGLYLYFIFHKINIFDKKTDDEITLILKNNLYIIDNNIDYKINVLIKNMLNYRFSKRPNLNKILSNNLFKNISRVKNINTNNGIKNSKLYNYLHEFINMDNDNIRLKNISNSTRES